MNICKNIIELSKLSFIFIFKTYYFLGDKMLNDKEIFNQSMVNNLYFLRTIREFATSIELSFYETNQQYIDKANSFRKEAESLVLDTVNLANGNVNKNFLDYALNTIKYSKDIEILTEKIFHINLNRNITDNEQSVKASNNIIVTNEMVKKVNEINEKALVLSQNFISFANDIKALLLKNELFSNLYPDYYTYVYDDISIYIADLKRIIYKENYSPIYVMDMEYFFNEALGKTAEFIRGWLDPIHLDLFDRATYFANAFRNITNAYLGVNMTPDLQSELKMKTINLVKQYKLFVEQIIEKLLDATIYLAVSPITIDNVYTSINSYLYAIEFNNENSPM